ncbi:MAG: bacterio-opsin activator domain-containing protein [Halanaeroarchaeum sp.]
MPDPIITASIALRVVGVVYSLVLLYRVNDARFGFLTMMLSLMAARQVATVQAGTTGLDELPGLVVSVLALLTVYYLSRYVQQEAEITRTIRKKNERLRTFRKAIEHAGHAIFLTDTDGTITYANQAVESVTGYTRGEVLGQDPSMWKSDHHDQAFYRDLWQTILDGEVWEGQIVNERKDGSQSWVDMTIAPIVGDDGTVEQFVAVDTDITERRRRKERITRQNERLEVLNHTNEVIRDINQELVQADDRETIEQAVCAEFAGSEQYEFALVSTQSVTSDAIRPRAWAGIEGDDLASVVGAFNDEGPDPISRATETGRVQIAGCGLGETPWESALDERDCHSVAVVPVVYGDTHYGTLSIGTADPNAFENIERGVFAELGETIGYAINAIESKEALMTDSVTEVEFRTRDTACFSVAMSAELGCTLDLQWLSPQSETLVEYFRVEDADPDAVRAFAEGSPSLADVQMVADGDDALFRFEVVDSCVARTIGDYGADLKGIRVEDGSARVRAHLSSSADVRAILEALQSSHGDVELLARRERERPRRTTQEVQTALEERLTDRQREALQTAYIGGFFDWPRERSGEEIASVMGIAQSTFLQHLRVAQRKVLTETLQSEPGVGRRAV